MILIKLFIIIARPFMPEYAKLKIVWIAQTIIYYDLLSYTGLIMGNFRHTIDLFHKGMIKATRNHYFANTVIFAESERGLIFGKYPQYNITPYVIQEAPWAVIAIVVLAVTTQVLKILNFYRFNVVRVLKIARETKSSVMLFSIVPIIAHSLHNMVSVGFSKK